MTELERIDKEMKKGGGSPTLSFVFGNWSLTKWKEWENDCNVNFNGCRWMKAYSDHLKARNSEENAQLWKRIQDLESQLNSLRQEPKRDECEIRNLNGEVLK